MNKVSRLLGSTALATGLIFGGSTGVAFANDNDRKNDNKSSHSRYDNDKDRDRKDDRRKHDNDRRHNDHKYLHICFDKRDKWGNWDKARYVWAEKDDDRKNCFIVRPYVKR